jgi:hypothetical protein
MAAWLADCFDRAPCNAPNPLCQPAALTSSLFPAGLAAHTQPGAAQALLLVLVLLQGSQALALLVLRPFISTVVNTIEAACACLELGHLAATLAAYGHLNGNVRLSGSYIQVGGRPSVAGLLGCRASVKPAHGEPHHGCVHRGSADPSLARHLRRSWTTRACAWQQLPW